LEFGSHVQTYEDHDNTHEDHDNSMQSRMTGGIALRPIGNEQGGHYFLCLSSGRRLNRNHWTELPLQQDVINRAYVLAHRGNANLQLIFADWHGVTSEDDDEDNDTDGGEHDSDSDDEDLILDDDSTSDDSDNNNMRLSPVALLA
jgi:hypothetical protein